MSALFPAAPFQRDGLTFRRMISADVPRVVDLERRAFRHPWSEDLIRQELTHEWSSVLLALRGDELLGVLIVWVVHDEVHVLNIATEPAHRRRGVARTLLTLLLEHAAERGCALCSLEVRRSNDGARALYRSMGFDEVGERRGYYADENEDAIVMSRAIVV